MHACEKGATGVYWGHRAVARVFYRDMIVHLDEMHGHEVEHYAIFGRLMKARGVRAVVAPVFWCAGGIAYGALTALAGRRAIWRSTAVIESIVERELKAAADFFEHRDPEIHGAILKILAEEVAHMIAGENNSPGSSPVDGLVTPAARAGASAAKGLAERL
jgi:3-demethoxyubiquinol 3-hydroxylase